MRAGELPARTELSFVRSAVDRGNTRGDTHILDTRSLHSCPFPHGRVIAWTVAIDFPHNTLRGLNDVWRPRYEEAYRRFSENPTAENRQQCTKALRTLADLLIRNHPPADE